MLSHLLATDDAPRDKLFWAGVALLIGGMLAAFAMVCSHQVRKAEVRAATLAVQQTAMADCLQYIPSATIGSCSRPQAAPPPNNLTLAVHEAPAPRPAAVALPVARPAAIAATPVSFTYR